MRSREEVEGLLLPFMAERNAGFWPADGWLDLIAEIHEGLLVYPDYRVVQVKEKFGGLCFYVSGVPSDAVRGWVRGKEAESYDICQQCGSRDDVAMRTYGWMATLCAACDSPSASRGYRWAG